MTASRSRFFFFCGLFFLSSPILPARSFSESSFSSVDLINQTCNYCASQSTVFCYEFCVTSLQEIPISHAANLQGLSLIAMELALENATDSVSTIEEMLKDGSLDLFTISCLKDCLDLYSEAAMALVDSIGAFLFQEYDDAQVWLSEVMEASATCEAGFKKEKGHVSPLTKQNYNLFQLSNIALCITTSLSLFNPSS